MISIVSYIGHPDKGGFKLVEKCEKSDIIEDDYIDGAIEFAINDVMLLSKENWDLVDQLWCYIGNMFEEIFDNDVVGTCFPDSGQGLRFTRETSGLMKMEVFEEENREAIVAEVGLIESVAAAGIFFFETIRRISPINDSWADYYIEVFRQATVRVKAR